MNPQFIYQLKLNRPALLTDGPTETEAEALAQHGAYLAELAGQGRVLLAGRTQIDSEEAYGIVILQAPDEPAALQIMQEDPAVQSEVMRAELHPYKIAVLADDIRSATE